VTNRDDVKAVKDIFENLQNSISSCRFKNFRVRDQSLYYAYCIFGWGGPACFLIVALALHHIKGQHLKPGFGEYSCWFAGKFPSFVIFLFSIRNIFSFS